MKSKSRMEATLNSEKDEEQLFHLVTIVYAGGAKVDIIVQDFEVQRNEETGRIASYQLNGVDIDVFNRLSKYVSHDNLVFAPLSLGSPQDMIAAFTTPIMET